MSETDFLNIVFPILGVLVGLVFLAGCLLTIRGLHRPGAVPRAKGDEDPPEYDAYHG